MVNNGASRACQACKQKRKKCDETRPACLRCKRGHRECPGYKTSLGGRKFVNYIGDAYSSLLHSPLSTDSAIPDWSTVEENARSIFYDDYCIISINRSLSRGYLHGLQKMVAQSGPESELTRACTIIALSNLGKKLCSDIYIARAKDLYSLSLRSFRLSISNELVFTSGESLITATLLGLYEVINLSDSYPGAHVGHAKGVSAILLSRSSPFDLICGGRLFRVSNPLSLDDLTGESSRSPSPPYFASTDTKEPQKFSVMCTPVFNKQTSMIDIVYIQTEPLIQRAATIFNNRPDQEQVRELLSEAEQMMERYYAWPDTTPEEWKARRVGFIAPNEEGIRPGVGYWPGHVTSYYDLYVASIWNSYRKASLLVMNVMISCHQIINGHDSPKVITRLQSDIERLTLDIIASVPFLFATDLQSFVRNANIGSPPLVPGRPVGGLLSIHVLYILLTLPITDPKLKEYVRDCLVFIGDKMGIGQAAVLSKVTA